MVLSSFTLQEAISALKKKSLTSLELTKACLARIKKYNPIINSFVTVSEEQALKRAKECDQLIRKGEIKPLLGIPIGLKDNWVIRQVRTTATSKVLDNYLPQYDATAVSKLKQAGAVIIGKTNMDAWGHGSSGEHSDYGNTVNPWNLKKVPGGSSSGSGAAVAADMCFAGTGTDTGGSIRQPAAYCNVVGLKPTYGRVSRYGIIAMASSTDSIGHITKKVWDSARVLSVTAGYDPYDATTGKDKVAAYDTLLTGEVKGIKIGVPREYFTEGVAESVKELCKKALKVLEGLGCELVEVSLPHTRYAYPVYATVTFAEISSNLARYDGIRYGLGREMFADEAKRRIMIGTHALSSGYADKYYHQGLKGRSLIIQDFIEAYKKVEVVVCPVWPFPAFDLGERSFDPLQMYLADVFTVTASLTGNPSISVPVGFTAGHLPFGMQIIGPNMREDLIFQVAYAYEQATQYYKEKPPL